MQAISEFVRRIATLIDSAEKYKPEEIRVYFSAPNPRHPTGETLTKEEEKMYEANFSWEKYGVLFSDKSGDFYIYTVTLNPWGTKQEDARVVKSDSEWNLYKDEEVTIVPDEVERGISVLRKPDLHPKSIRTNYVNTDKSDKGHEYSSEEFKRFFDDDFFVVLTKNKTLENPFGKPIGKIGKPGEKTK